MASDADTVSGALILTDRANPYRGALRWGFHTVFGWGAFGKGAQVYQDERVRKGAEHPVEYASKCYHFRDIPVASLNAVIVDTFVHLAEKGEEYVQAAEEGAIMWQRKGARGRQCVTREGIGEPSVSEPNHDEVKTDGESSTVTHASDGAQALTTTSVSLLAKKNQDGSYSVSIPVGVLTEIAFVDFYEDGSGGGYQRLESMRSRRGREIASYLDRCVQHQLPPRLFELTANCRLPAAHIDFDPIDEDELLGILSITANAKPWLSVIDGGTRLHGLELALANGIIDNSLTIDVRMFEGLSLASEVAQFLLINEKQKRVRTDLSLRVVQRMLDNDALEDDEKRVLQTVVPTQDSWKFEASRIASKMNKDKASPWFGMIQMPNDRVRRPIKLQAFLMSLKPLLANPDLGQRLKSLEKATGKPKTDVLQQTLVNFWTAVRDVNTDAHAEPTTNVLWGSIGASACHIALAPVILSVLDSSKPDLRQQRFHSMVSGGLIADFAYWYTKPGTKHPRDTYPGAKGEGPRMTGAANYSRLGKDLEQEWRAALHSENSSAQVLL